MATKNIPKMKDLKKVLGDEYTETIKNLEQSVNYLNIPMLYLKITYFNQLCKDRFFKSSRLYYKNYWNINIESMREHEFFKCIRLIPINGDSMFEYKPYGLVINTNGVDHTFHLETIDDIQIQSIKNQYIPESILELINIVKCDISKTKENRQSFLVEREQWLYEYHNLACFEEEKKGNKDSFTS